MIDFLTTDARHFQFDEIRREITDYIGDDKNVVIPSSIDGMEVISIGPEAFWNKGLTSVVLPPTLSVIGFYAFAFNQLKDIRIPDSVALIEDGAFMYNALESIRLGKNIFAINHSVFQHNCLTHLVLPENIQEILPYALDANIFSSITFEGAPTFIHQHAFNIGSEENARIKIQGMFAKDLRALMDHHAKHVDAFRALRDTYQ